MGAGQINQENLELGPCNLYKGEKPRASKLTNVSPTNADLYFAAQRPGADGNSITVTIASPTYGVALSVTCVGTTITVATGPTTTAKQVRDALNNDAGASGLIYATLPDGTRDGSSVIAAGSYTLSGGSDTETMYFLGALGDATAVDWTVTTVGATAAQTGTIKHKVFITGGDGVIKAPLKELTFKNFSIAFPGAVVIERPDGTKRIDFNVRVGKDLRKDSFKLVLKKLTEGVETTDPTEILTVPQAGPAPATISLAFHPTNQRELAAAFQMYPDANNRLAYFGTDDI